MTHQGATDDDMDSSWPSGGATAIVAGPPTASVAAPDGAGVLTVGSIATVAGTLLIFVVIAAGLVSLQYFYNAWDDDDDRGSRRGGQVPRRRRGGGGGIRAANRGVDPELLRSLPVTVYCASAPGSGKEEEGAVECAVCLAELEDGEAARFLPRCGHGFHAACVDTWLTFHTTCPLCRLTVAKPDSSPAPALALLPVPPEPANYYTAATANLPASVLVGVSVHGAVAAAATVASDGDTGASTGTTCVLVIDIPELAVQTRPRAARPSRRARRA
jgi:E3 ubiquitin-protein ligase EL5